MSKDDHWIEKATRNKGALHKELNVPKGKNIPNGKLEKAAHAENPVEAKRANLALTLKAMHRKYGGEV